MAARVHLPGDERGKTACGVVRKGGSATGNWTIWASQVTCPDCIRARYQAGMICRCGLYRDHDGPHHQPKAAAVQS